MAACRLLGLQRGSLEWDLLADLDKIALTKCGEMSDMALALAEFSNKVGAICHSN